MTQSPEIRVEIFDTTLRDGAQALPAENQFPDGSKVELAQYIVSQGVDTIEAGFPATMGDSEEIREVARTVGRTQYDITPLTIENGVFVPLESKKIWTPVITGLARCVPAEIEGAYGAVEDADRPGVHIFIASAEEHMRAKHPGKTQDEILEMGIDSIRHARQVGGPDMRLEFSLEAASTTDPKVLERFVKAALAEDINVLNIPDTLGAASPKRTYQIFSDVTRWMIESGRNTDVIISAHNHNDGERAVQNSITALHAVIDTSVAMEAIPPVFQNEVTSGHNLGERNGNTNLAPFVRNVLTDRPEFGLPVRLELDTRRFKPVAEFVTNAAGLELDPNAAVVGLHTITHRSGVHSDAIIKGGAAVYASVDPRGFGHDLSAIHEDGKYQGRRGKENLGGTEEYRSELVMKSEDVLKRIRLMGFGGEDAEGLEMITVRANTEARKFQRKITDTEIEAMVDSQVEDNITPKKIQIFGKTTVDAPESQHGWHRAYVEIQIGDTPVEGIGLTETGNIDAGRAAVDEALATAGQQKVLPRNFEFQSGELNDLKVYPLEKDFGAVGGVLIDVTINGRRVTAYAEDTSVDDASVKAYLKAINLVQRIEKRERVAGSVDRYVDTLLTAEKRVDPTDD